MVSFETLIKIAPFNNDTRSKILMQANSLSDDQKLKLTQMAWSMITTLYQAKLKQRFELELLDVREGKKELANDAKQTIENELVHELISQLELSGTEEEIVKVKETIQQHATSSLPSFNQTS